MTEEDLRLDLVICSQWERIDSVRDVVANCVAAVFGELDLKDSLAMVSAELLENALKYGQPEGRVRLSIRTDGHDLVVTVGNNIDKKSRHPQTLQRWLTWLRQFDDAFAAYTAALRQVYERNDEEDSGLGFARIGYEGHCQLACDVSRSGFVSVSARCRRPDAVRLRSA